MKCPHCKKEGLKYINKEKKIRDGKGGRQRYELINRHTICKKCGWEGIA